MEMDGNPMFLIFGKVHCIVPYLIKKKTPFRPVLAIFRCVLHIFVVWVCYMPRAMLVFYSLYGKPLL